MTQQQAIEIIAREGLTHYHMDERETDEDIMALPNSQWPWKGEKEIVIRQQGTAWHVYSISKEKTKDKCPFVFDQEEQAWDMFIQMLQNQKERAEETVEIRDTRNKKKEVLRLTRREAEQIIVREKLREVHFQIGRTGLPGDIVIKRSWIGGWQVYQMGDWGTQDCLQTFWKEKEAWGDFIRRLRSEKEYCQQRRKERKEEERLSSLTREQAEEIITQEGLIQYNMDGDREKQAGDTVIREGVHWEVYEVSRHGRKDEKTLARFFQEEEAWGYLVKKLRYYNQQMKLRLHVQGDEESWIRRLIQHTEKGIKDDREKREQEILCGLTYAMEEEEVKQIIAREELTDYFIPSSPKRKSDVIVMIHPPGTYRLWEVYEKGAGKRIVHDEAEFYSEGEAWRWFLERLREKNRKKRGQVEERDSCYLSQKEAEEIIHREGLTHYNIDPERKELPGELILRKCIHWEIYEIRENGEKDLPYVRYDEKKAWGLFIRQLKSANEIMRHQKRMEEYDIQKKEQKKREAIKAHVLPRERAEQVLVQENLTGYNKNEPREDRPEEMVIRKKRENWEVYCTDSKGEVHGEKELFTVEEEAWGWFIKGVRDNAKIREINRELFGQDCLFAEIER